MFYSFTLWTFMCIVLNGSFHLMSTAICKTELLTLILFSAVHNIIHAHTLSLIKTFYILNTNTSFDVIRILYDTLQSATNPI